LQTASGWAAGTMLVAAAMALLLLFGLHWATQTAAGRELNPLTCYVIGCTSILALLGLWCLVQPGKIPAWWAFAAAVSITGGAGLGTMAGHWLDDRAALRWERGIRDGKQRANADRGR